MGKSYGHVTIEERCEVARLQAAGYSVREIAANLDRSPSTVARELKAMQEPGDTSPGMRTNRPMPGDGAGPGWSGTGVCGSRYSGGSSRAGLRSRWRVGWAMESFGKRVISHESIYRFIYGQMARKKDYGWRHYLPRAKSKRGWRGRKGGSPASFMAMRRPIAERPQSAADRRTPGHWEADLMLFSTYGHAVRPCTNAIPASS